jgi:hypothetical protein
VLPVLTVPPATAITIYLAWDRADLEAGYRLLVDCELGRPRDARPKTQRGTREPPYFVSGSAVLKRRATSSSTVGCMSANGAPIIRAIADSRPGSSMGPLTAPFR